MTKKSLAIITACIAITLCVAGVGVAFAWYSNSAGAGNRFELNADGYLVVYFAENEYDLDAIKPAVAKKGAITNNVTEFDVLTVNEYIVERATIVEHEGEFHYLNLSENPDAEAEITVFCEAYMVFADGTKEKLSLEYDLSVEIGIEWLYVSENSGGGSDITIGKDDWQNPADTKFDINGNADFSIKTVMYLRQPDDLCNPRIREAEKLNVAVMIGAVPLNEDGNE